MRRGAAGHADPVGQIAGGDPAYGERKDRQSIAIFALFYPLHPADHLVCALGGEPRGVDAPCPVICGAKAGCKACQNKRHGGHASAMAPPQGQCGERGGKRALKEGVLGVGTSFRVGTEDFIPFLERVLLDGGMFIRNGSGALMLSYVAAGRLIGYFEPHMNAWDALAGLVLVLEAGGATNDFMAGNGLLRGNAMMAANDAILARLSLHSGISLTQGFESRKAS